MKLVGPMIAGLVLLALVATRGSDQPSAGAIHVVQGDRLDGEVRLRLEPGRAVAVTLRAPTTCRWLLDAASPVEARELRATTNGNGLATEQTFEFTMPRATTDATTVTFYLHDLRRGAYEGPVVASFHVTLVRPSGE